MLWAIGQHKNFFKTPLSYISATRLKIVMGKKIPLKKKKKPKNKINKNVFRKYTIFLKPQVHLCKYGVGRENFLNSTSLCCNEGSSLQINL